MTDFHSDKVTYTKVEKLGAFEPSPAIKVGSTAPPISLATPGRYPLPMIGLLQRVSHAEVCVDTKIVGSIQAGLLVLVAVERGDTEQQADRLLERLLTYRVFPDEEGRMNRSVQDTAGGLLLVSQFTLAADTRKGSRPGFSPAAEPREGERLFEYLVRRARERHGVVETGEFGAHMQVTLTNDGPVTFWLQVGNVG
jgi:D-tyrosyl-tRNA(Tyr) deacylase